MGLRVHHLNCGTFRPFGGRLVDGQGSPFRAGRLVCHCLLIETPSGLLLVDTGIGVADIADPHGRLGSDFVRRVRPVLDPDETAVRQVARLGYSPGDVRHIVLTHLDRDHAGGLSDFPRARVHVHGAALSAALQPLTDRDRDRHRSAQWEHGALWEPHEHQPDESWFGFRAARSLPGLPPDVLTVPLAGHSTGHVGVAVHAQYGERERWLLHAGDAYFFRGEVNRHPPNCTPGLRLFQRKAQVSESARLDNQRRLRDLAADAAAAVTVFSSHDATEFDDLSAAVVAAG